MISPQPVAPASLPAKHKTVVVIDDVADLVELVVMLLELEGYRAYGCCDGESGIALAIEQRADVVMLDFQMPGLNGGAVGHRLRSDPACRHMKIVMCSGTPEPIVRAAFSGFDVFLAKPVLPAHFLSVVDRLCAER